MVQWSKKKGTSMNAFYRSLASGFLFLLPHFYLAAEPPAIAHFQADTQWAVVGAGPAGIICIGLLLDLGVNPTDITWIDPEFKVGRIGKYYQHVPANVEARIFCEFLNACRTFRQCAAEAIDQLMALDLDQCYPLEIVVTPLQIITDSLCGSIIKKESRLTSLHFYHDVWQVGIEKESFTAAHVILATGAKPKTLDFDCKNTIPLDFALDKPTLATVVTEKDTVAVVGSAHSAILILKYLSELPVGRIINFYLHEPEFHHPESGLGGITAEWAKKVLLSNPPINLIRIHNKTNTTLTTWLPLCTKIVYAIGYEREPLPPINNNNPISYDEKSGVIAPRLFGIGIAFPEKYVDDQGVLVSKIGLENFMNYAQRVLPQWIATKDTCKNLTAFDELFDIRVL